MKWWNEYILKWCNGEMVQFQFINGDMVKPQENIKFKKKSSTHLSLNKFPHIWYHKWHIKHYIFATYILGVLLSLLGGGSFQNTHF